MNKLLAIILAVGGLYLAYLALTTYQDATANFTILGFDVSASDQEARRQAILYATLAVVCLGVGWVFYRRK